MGFVILCQLKSQFIKTQLISLLTPTKNLCVFSNFYGLYTPVNKKEFHYGVIQEDHWFRAGAYRVINFFPHQGSNYLLLLLR